MQRLPAVLAVFLFLMVYSVSSIFALTLDKIGVTTVTNSSITSWYYQGTNPTFSGTTDPSAAVSVSINGASSSVTADTAGAWSYVPTTLTTTGTYPIVITSGTQTMSFSLDLTAAGSSTASSLATTKGGTMSGSVEMPDTLPQSGSFEQTVMMIAAGLLLVGGGMIFYWKVVPRLLFVEDSEQEVK